MYTLLPSWLSPSLLWFVIPFQGADTFVPFFFSLLQLSFVGGWVYLFGLFSLFHFGYFLCDYISLILFCTVPILPFIPSRVFFISYSAFHLRSSIWVCSFFFFSQFCWDMIDIQHSIRFWGVFFFWCLFVFNGHTCSIWEFLDRKLNSSRSCILCQQH